MPARSIRKVLEKTPQVFVDPNQSVFEVVSKMMNNHESAALVVENNKTLGIVTEKDLITRVLSAGLDAKSTPVRKIMTSDTVTIGPDALFGNALYLMHEYNVRHIPVIEDGHPVGVVSRDNARFGDIEEYVYEARMLDHITEIL